MLFSSFTSIHIFYLFLYSETSPEVLPPVEISSTKTSKIEAKEEEDENSPKEENIEGRFFIKDKLCALGLADVSSWNLYLKR